MVFLIAFLAVANASPLFGQGKGSPIFKHSATKAQIVAGVKEGCPRSLFNVSCGEFLGMLQASDPKYAPATLSALPAYLETLTEGQCGVEKAILAGVFYTPTRAILYNEHRSFGPGERCLKTPSSRPEPVRNVMSTDCGNGNVMQSKPEMSLSDYNRIKDRLVFLTDSLSQVKDKQHIGLTANGSVELRWNDRRENITRSQVIDTLGVALDITVNPLKPVILPAVHDTVTVEKNKPLWPFIGGVVVGGIAGYFAHSEGSCPTTYGSPVNPPNNKVPRSGSLLGFHIDF
jgi:hypothetical protein